ncbi:hypothetical protein [Comamonas sp. JUb58]|uniref:hypothetical protein n=1 Tax=Comamonas sp. JUb58 TaxID=2485114 RepID=UPI00105C5534|nr:hypothetical protein [Comamonas sp. JUb58]
MQLPKPASQGQAAGLILGTVVLANIVTTWVLISNLDAMLYPVEADAIMIPIANNFLNSLCLLLLAGVGICLPRHHIAWRMASRILIGVAVMYALALAVYWWYPFHYLAGASFLPAVLACAWAVCLPARKLPARGANTRPSELA